MIKKYLRGVGWGIIFLLFLLMLTPFVFFFLVLLFDSFEDKCQKYASETVKNPNESIYISIEEKLDLGIDPNLNPSKVNKLYYEEKKCLKNRDYLNL